MKLSLREKVIVVLGSALVLFALFWAVVIDPVNAKTALLDKKIDYLQKRQVELSALSKRYDSLNAQLTAVKQKVVHGKEFSILSHLETIAQSRGLKANITQMKPKPGQNTRHYKESVVEIKMTKVDLDQIVGYLHEVENGAEPLRIKLLHLAPRFDNPDLLDANFDIASYQLP